MDSKNGKTPSRKRSGHRGLGIVAAVVATVLVLGLVSWKAGWLNNLPLVGKDAKPGVFQVDEKGGSYPLPSGGKITVPKGAVNKPTTLTVTAPRELGGNEAAPLTGVRQGGVTFDVSLSRGTVRDIQPSKNKPLTLTMPLKAPQPQGGARMFAVPYTDVVNENGETGYVLLPSHAAGADNLTVLLPHLSAKYITYVTDQQLLDSFNPEPVRRSKGKNCPQNLTVDGVKVHLKGQGWSTKKVDSAIFVCLAASKDNAGYVRLNVANMIGYILSVKATGNVRLPQASRGGLEEELVKYVAKRMPGSGDVQAYLGRDGKLVGSIDTQSLYDGGAKIELWASGNTFWAETAIKVTGLLVGLITGEGDAGKTLKIVKAALHVKDVIGCVEDAADSATDEKSVTKFADAVVGCFGVIAEAIGEYVDPLSLLWKFGWAIDAAKALVEQITSAINGGKLQQAGTLTATVTAEPPPCPRGAKLSEIVRNGLIDLSTRNGNPLPSSLKTWNEMAECRDLWAYGSMDTGLYGPGHPLTTDSRTAFILRFIEGEWRMVEEGQEMGGSPYCVNGQAPAFVREWLACYDQ